MSNFNTGRTSGSISNSISNSSNSNSSSTFRSTSFSAVSSNINGQQRSYSEAIYSDPSGTRVHRTSQEPGKAPREERIEYDSAGRRIDSQESRGRIEDVTDEREKEKKAERLYEENMEEEYAKREGGA